MKLWALMILSSSVVALGFGSDAEGAPKRSKGSVSKGYSANYNYTTRSAVGRTRDGLCRFDNGVPLSDLNLNDRCDYEEFWRRQSRPGTR
jgi:hypothetical protein